MLRKHRVLSVDYPSAARRSELSDASGTELNQILPRLLCGKIRHNSSLIESSKDCLFLISPLRRHAWTDSLSPDYLRSNSMVLVGPKRR